MLTYTQRITPKVLLSITATAVLLTSPQPLHAQNTLEEIVVTARKREESLQDVPISVQAISGTELEARGIIDLDRLAPITPNFNYAQNAGASDTLFIRGLANLGSGPQFEQGVGQVLNGFLTTQGRVGRTNLVDLQQLEILRGPQGAIIGKNNTLGAINITTRKPTDQFEASVSGGVDFEASQGGFIEGVISGPLSDRVRGRAVVNFQDRDGWVESRATGIDAAEREDVTSRLILDFALTDRFNAELLWQYNNLDQNGKFREAFACVDPATAMAAGFDCALDASNQSQNFVDGVDIGEPFLLTQNLYGLTLTWDFANFSVTSLSGFLEYEIFDDFDSSLDPAPLNSRSIDNTEDFQQFTQEVRIASSGDNFIDYIGGVFYQNDAVEFVQNSDFPISPGPPFGGGQTPAKRVETASRDSDVLAGFGQLVLHFSPQLDLSLGGRLTRDEREGAKQQSMNLFNTDIQDLTLCSNNPASPFGPSGFRVCTNAFELDNDPTNDGQFQLGVLADTIDETDFSWDVALTWRPVEGQVLYIAAAEGFKSGGFDLRATNPNAPFVFDSETANNFEIGGKHTWRSGRLRTNWALYHTSVDGLQTSSNDPVTISQTAINADATSYGLEYEVSWLATDDLTLSVVGAFIDTEYDNFIAPCIATSFVVGLGVPDTCNVDQNGDGSPDGQDLRGEELPFAPNIQVTASASYIWREAFPGTDLSFDLDYAWVDDHIGSVDQNPFADQAAVGLLDAAITLQGAENRWNVSLVGSNLTDEIVRHVVSDTTACPSTVPAPGGSGTCLFSFARQTRAIGLRAEYNFF